MNHMDRSSQQIPEVQPAAEKKQTFSYSKKDSKKLVLIYLGFAIVLYVGIYYFFISKNSSNPYSKSTTQSGQKANLNPNTGSLYGDINTRLREVLK